MKESQPQNSQESELPESIFGDAGHGGEEVQDIFADSQPPVVQGASRPGQTVAAPQPQQALPSFIPPSSSPTLRIALWVVGGIVVVLIVGIGVFMILRGGSNNTSVVPSTPQAAPLATPPIQAVPKSESTEKTPETAATESPESVSAEKPSLDSDGDGLSDAEELTLGTSAVLVDSDNDGLSDREEVKVYMTNVLSADTDGDGYLDGEEVKNGYDPKGPGRLYQAPPSTLQP